MKNRIGVWIAAAIMMPCIAAISFFSVREAKEGGNTFFWVLGGRAELRNTIELPLSEMDELQVTYGSKNLKVYPIEGDTVIIKEYLISSRETKADVEKFSDSATGSRVVTITGGQRRAITVFGLFNQEERIELYIPKEGLTNLSLQAASGNITTESNFALKTEELTVKTNSGNIKWKDSEAEKLHIQAGSGNITLGHMAGNLEVRTGSGNIKVNGSSGNISMKAGSGNITAEGLSGQGSMETGSGNIKADALEITGDMSLKTRSGNIHMTLPEELSFQVQIQTGSGNVRTDFEEVLTYNKKGNQAEGTMGENPSCLIQAEANSGNVHIMHSGR